MHIVVFPDPVCICNVSISLSGELGDCRNGVAFPWNIGCGLAGGDWHRYSDVLAGFANTVPFRTLVIKINPVPV